MALVHDELTRRGGAEVVFEELAELFPQADLFTLYAGRAQMRVAEALRPVRTSFLQRLPTWFRRHPGRLLPLLSYAAEQFDFANYEVVISSASGFAKAIITRSLVPHICYCHTPTRYLWDDAATAWRQAPPGAKWAARLLLHYLRLIDYAAAARVTIFIANSEYTQARIAKYYRRQSEVIYPPVKTDFFTPASTTKKYFLAVGRLTPSKNFEQAIRVCEKLELPLIIVGSGREEWRLKHLAGKHTRFTGAVTDKELRQLYRGAQALLQPGIEDFGLASAEALACGTPVIACGEGGSREIVSSSQLGILYQGATEEALGEGIGRFLRSGRRYSPEILQKSTLRFSTASFRHNICRLVASAVESVQRL
jgi:glycosyltransferase involved in cell wall biosynthesis